MKNTSTPAVTHNAVAIPSQPAHRLNHSIAASSSVLLATPTNITIVNRPRPKTSGTANTA
jgi:hypothetical protein